MMCIELCNERPNKRMYELGTLLASYFCEKSQKDTDVMDVTREVHLFHSLGAGC